MKVVVVELPAKAKTINKYLGSGYEVLASFGHIRDLPAKDGSVDPDDDFKMVWQIETKGAKHVSEIARAVKGAEKLILATDPDREGEAISWHVVEALREKRALKDVPIERVTFNAITKTRCRRRCASRARSTRPSSTPTGPPGARLSRRLHPVTGAVAQIARRALGRTRPVRGAAARLRPGIRDRDLRGAGILVARRRRSRPRKGGVFDARLVGADGKKITRLDIGKGEEAEAFKRDLELATFTVGQVEAKPARRHPYPPFMTSTLQQEASRKLGLAPAQTMRLAQRLYEGVDIGGETVGLITYMRTDGVDMAPEAIQAARRVIAKEYGDRYRAWRSAQIHDQGEERPGGARGHPSDRYGPPAQAGGALSRCGAGPPLRAHLDAHRREPDGVGRT